MIHGGALIRPFVAGHGLSDLRRPCTSQIVGGDPEEHAAGAAAIQLFRQVEHDLCRLCTVHIGRRFGTVPDAKPGQDFGRVSVEHLCRDGGEVLQRRRVRAARIGHAIQRRARDAVVVLRHHEVHVVSDFPQDVEIGGVGLHVDIHGRVGDEVAFFRWQPRSEPLRHGLDEVLRLVAPVEARISLVVLVEVLVVDVDAVEIQFLHDTDQLVDDLVFAAEAVLPAVVFGGGPAAAHAGPAKADEDLLAGILQILDERARVGTTADGWHGNVAGAAAVVLARTPSVADGKCDHHVRVVLVLLD
mmetsp:Transcript_12391/g.35984  ORF Transcript_12391/g.35984 Transcript_12391/m.35984 type:complete len:301 (-) Transcript_12391:1243-2145(-)